MTLSLSRGGHPEWHIQQDVLPLTDGDCSFKTVDGIEHHIEGQWDLLICHPPCTDLAVSGARWFKEKQADGRQQRSIELKSCWHYVYSLS